MQIVLQPSNASSIVIIYVFGFSPFSYPLTCIAFDISKLLFEWTREK